MKPQFKNFLVEKEHNPDQVWELFHENSKVSRHQRVFGNDYIVNVMQDHCDALDYDSMPAELLEYSSENINLDVVSAIKNRISQYDWSETNLQKEQLAALLDLSYGNADDFELEGRVRPRRNCPSGGAMYPLEIFVSVRNVDDLLPGLYHFNPHAKKLSRLREGDQTFKISRAFVQREIIDGAACVWMVTSIFERTVFKYGNRGYRFALLEAGHMAQIANTVATSMGINCHNIGGYFDYEIDDYLGLDGINHSTLYCLAFGKPT